MQIEVRNLLIIAIVLFIVGIIFMFRKKLLYCLCLLLLVAVCVIQAGRILYTIHLQQVQEQIQKENEVRENSSSDDATLDIDIDGAVDKTKEFIGGTVDEALPKDLYYITDEKYSYGVNNNTVKAAEEFTQTLKDFVGETNK